MVSHITLEALCPPGDTTDTTIAQAVEDLINGKLDPMSAARKIDDAIGFEEPEIIHERRMSDVSSTDVSNNEIFEDADWEDLSIRRTFLLEMLPKVAAQVPAWHPGQEKLVILLKCLPQLPDRQITMRWGDGTKRDSLWPQGEIDDFGKYMAFVEPSLYTTTADVTDIAANPRG